MPIVRVSSPLAGHHPDFVAVDFLLDTGSVSTCLHPDDASSGSASSLPCWPTQVDGPRREASAASAVHPAPSPARRFDVFLADDGSVARQITGTIDVAQPTPSNATIPSLLGMDILRHFPSEHGLPGAAARPRVGQSGLANESVGARSQI
jgi:hypothetical protein